MKVEFIKRTFDNCTGWKVANLEWCCDKLRDNPIIELTTESIESYYSDSPPVMGICETEFITDWDDEYEQDTWHAIKYCPFCGEPIDIKVIHEEDVTDIYMSLTKQREELNKKRRNCDSIKRRCVLDEQIRELDDEINGYFGINYGEYRGGGDDD